MKQFMQFGLYALLITVVLGGAAFAHPGRTDSSGGHTNRRTGGYHTHNSGTPAPAYRSTPRTEYRSSAPNAARSDYASGYSASDGMRVSAAAKEAEAARRQAEAIRDEKLRVQREQASWASTFDAEMRIWRDKSGTYSVEAVYHSYIRGGQVRLQKRDRSIISVELAALSDDDRLFAVQCARQRGHLTKRE